MLGTPPPFVHPLYVLCVQQRNYLRPTDFSRAEIFISTQFKITSRTLIDVEDDQDEDFKFNVHIQKSYSTLHTAPSLLMRHWVVPSSGPPGNRCGGLVAPDLQ